MPPRLVEPPQRVAEPIPTPSITQRVPDLVPPRLVEPPQRVAEPIPTPPITQREPELVPPRLVEPPQRVAEPISTPPITQRVPEPLPSRQPVPIMTLGPASVPLTSNLTTTGAGYAGPVNPALLIVPEPGRQTVGSLHGFDPGPEADGAVHVCLISGLGRRRQVDGETVSGVVPGFHMTDAMMRNLPFHRHLRPGCFISLERRQADEAR